MVDSNAEMTKSFVLIDLLRDIIINNGVSKKPNIVHENTTIENTLPLLIRAIIIAVRATMSVMLVILVFENFVNSSMSCEIFPEQLMINESAVDIVAANIPEMIKPTMNGLNNICAIIGKASSGSNPIF